MRRALEIRGLLGSSGCGPRWMIALLAGFAGLLGGADAQAQQTSTLTTLVSFSGTNGAYPYASLIQGSDGNFYGTTYRGGTSSSCSGGCGTVFELTPSGTLTTLVSFSGTNGAYPYASLIQGSDGNFYGTTTEDGYFDDCSTCGTVFKLTPSGTLTTLASFNGTNGAYPQAGLIQGNDGNFYGTTLTGGEGICDPYQYDSACGTVFKLTPTGTLTTLVLFNETTGYNPAAGLIQGSDGNFYGTTVNGGGGGGTVFKLTPTGTLTTLVSVAAGIFPYASLIQGSDGNFYGTTSEGGISGYGTVFKLTPSGTLTTLVNFETPTGRSPHAGLIQGSDGNFYGTTSDGGIGGYGTVFKLTPSGTLTTLVSFSGTNGASPFDSLIQGSDGNFYGTTSGDEANYYSYGTVFKLQLPPGPIAPTDLTSEAKSRGKAALKWTATDGATSYNVYEGTASGDEANTPVQTGLTKTKATVKSLTDGKTYCFTVAGVDAKGVGLPSNEACITAE